MRVLSCLALSATAAAAAPTAADLLSSQYAYTFEEFKSDFGKDYADASEHAARRAAFHAKLKDIAAHNDAAAGHSWKKGVNQFSDMLDAERELPRGLARGAAAARRAAAPVPSSAHLATAFGGDAAALPPSVDWRDHKPPVISAVKDQGGCGSCWAFSTVETLESAVAIATGKLLTLSPQQVVSCAPNPLSCGGTGGCDGSVQWLGFNYTAGAGIVTEADYPYTAKTGTCEQPLPGKTVAGNTGFVRLPANNYSALMNAVATVGPIAISLDASWRNYESGVYTGACGATIDHAVVLVGYGTEGANDYYLVRNSWGESFGEGGYIKLKRNADDSDNCATDENPSSGTECKPYPKTQKVCGACGILSDSSYPTGAFAK